LISSGRTPMLNGFEVPSYGVWISGGESVAT
jgi:hypothetical protein